MIHRIRLTALRREILTELLPGRGESADELKRRVARGRGLSPEHAGWAAFTTSYARAIRLLEEREAVFVHREPLVFNQPCATWVRLTSLGERTRARLVGPDERLFIVEDDVAAFERLLTRAAACELERLAALVARERSRRLAGG